jgi:hypothetical protein
VIIVLAAVQPCASGKKRGTGRLRPYSGRLCAAGGQHNDHSRRGLLSRNLTEHPCDCIRRQGGCPLCPPTTAGPERGRKRLQGETTSAVLLVATLFWHTRIEIPVLCRGGISGEKAPPAHSRAAGTRPEPRPCDRRRGPRGLPGYRWTPRRNRGCGTSSATEPMNSSVSPAWVGVEAGLPVCELSGDGNRGRSEGRLLGARGVLSPQVPLPQVKGRCGERTPVIQAGRLAPEIRVP